MLAFAKCTFDLEDKNQIHYYDGDEDVGEGRLMVFKQPSSVRPFVFHI